MCLGIPAEIISICNDDDHPVHRTGRVQYGHLTKEINLACVPEAMVGDHVLVHAGIAIGQLHPDDVEPIQSALDSLTEPDLRS